MSHSNNLPPEMLDKLNEFSIELNFTESLSRILLEEIRFGDNLENFDVENLSNETTAQV